MSGIILNICVIAYLQKPPYHGDGSALTPYDTEAIMFARKFGENLRRLDVGCVQRVRWLGAWKPQRNSDLAAAEDKRQQMKAVLLRMDDFNRR